jgi:hypothetical protein
LERNISKEILLLREMLLSIKTFPKKGWGSPPEKHLQKDTVRILPNLDCPGARQPEERGSPKRDYLDRDGLERDHP